MLTVAFSLTLPIDSVDRGFIGTVVDLSGKCNGSLRHEGSSVHPFANQLNLCSLSTVDSRNPDDPCEMCMARGWGDRKSAISVLGLSLRSRLFIYWLIVVSFAATAHIETFDGVKVSQEAKFVFRCRDLVTNSLFLNNSTTFMSQVS